MVRLRSEIASVVFTFGDSEWWLVEDASDSLQKFGAASDITQRDSFTVVDAYGIRSR